MGVIRYLSCACVVVAMAGTASQAQDTAETRRLTLLTFNQPVQLPGTTLPAGTYRFEMADLSNAAHTVRVLSEDGQKVIGTFATISSTLPQRDLKDQNTLVMFAERPAGQPQAAREWFYPGRSIGEEFIYPREQAQAIANANKASVASDDDGKVVRVEPESAAGGAHVARTAEAPAAAAAPQAETRTPAGPPARELARQDDAARTGAPAPPEPASVGTSGQVQSQQPASAQTRTLPRTASELPLVQLLSVLALAAALAIRRYRLGLATER
jgi:hypothetical protein